ncbi:MAG: ABC-2 transporter permease [Firmicutes bacterium]|nr:ABC-2 transporter permease [Candidatus Fiminaster equi]
MKNLFFKELKLSIHPLCYVFVLLFGLMGLIPNYPACVGPVYLIAAYTFLFLGANKGQTTNDLFYSCNLPLRKKDVITARMVSITYLKVLLFIPLLATLLIRFFVIYPSIRNNGGAIPDLGFDINQGFALFGIIILVLSLTDLIYLPWFYKTGKSIIGPTIVGVIFYILVAFLGTMMLPKIPNLKDMVTIGGPNEKILVQVLLFVGCLLASVGIEFLTHKLSKDNLLKLDF